MASYKRGESKDIIVGAAALFVSKPTTGILTPATIPDVVEDQKYTDTLSETSSGFRNVGYTMNGLEIVFQPDFGEVQVDQVLDVAKLYKQGMTVNLNTAFAEATLENLLLAVAAQDADLDLTGAGDGDDGTVDNTAFAGNKVLNLSAGQIGECPVERSLIAVGPGTGDCALGSTKERIYVAYRALSIENVTVSAKRDEPTMFEVSFRLLPDDATSSYGKIVDRTVSLS
jgi:hypothetical protein